MAQLVKNLPAMRETWVQSLGWEDPLEKGTGYPLQYSGLENSMNCTVYGVTEESDMTERLSLTSFRIDWFDLLAVQGTVKSLLQHRSSKT